MSTPKALEALADKLDRALVRATSDVVNDNRFVNWMQDAVREARDTLRSLASQPAEPEGMETTAGSRAELARHMGGAAYGRMGLTVAAVLRDLDRAEAELAALKQPVGNEEVEKVCAVLEAVGSWPEPSPVDLLRRQARQIEDMRGAQTPAAIDVLAERKRQVEVEGWTPKHDDTHDCGQLASGHVQCPASRGLVMTGEAKLTKAQRKFLFDLDEEPDAWAECTSAEYRTALSLQKRGLIEFSDAVDQVSRSYYFNARITPAGRHALGKEGDR